MKKNYGFVPPVIDSTHYVLGAYNSLPKIVLQPDGQWDNSLPEYEAQADKYETYGCAVWGTENALETLEKKLNGGKPNYDEKFIYNIVPVRPPGVDPHRVIEAARKNGLIANRELPETFDEFITPTPPSFYDLQKGQEYLKKWEIGHEWVFQNVAKKIAVSLMKLALTYSCLAASVSAWEEDPDGLFVSNGRPNNHWCVIYGYTEVNGQVFFKVFDSYDHSKKILHPDHEIQFCKRYSLTKIVDEIPVYEPKKKSWWQVFLNWFSSNFYVPKHA